MAVPRIALIVAGLLGGMAVGVLGFTLVDGPDRRPVEPIDLPGSAPPTTVPDDTLPPDTSPPEPSPDGETGDDVFVPVPEPAPVPTAPPAPPPVFDDDDDEGGGDDVGDD